MATKRRFTAAQNDARCATDIKLKDGSGAQCMRAAKIEGLCRQHASLASYRVLGSGLDLSGWHKWQLENQKTNCVISVSGKRFAQLKREGRIL